MSEALILEPEGGKEFPQENLYNGKTFENSQTELNFLQRLQTMGKLEGIEWQRELHFPRLQELTKELKKGQDAGPTQEQKDRYNHLTRLRNENNDPWSDDLVKEFVELQRIMDEEAERQRRSSGNYN